ncbi:hypothetical protein [Paenibacillus albus]|uniref:Uncharacterized protein n=1 Tax=Paenibacillus albus TaxID=2495582 RepID=A0A3Q8X3G8_9BACL|nr:hypothetical protein [Paenibacillus albus]AZN38355.1 hypothetical protein EJC50_00680 [Paenibacillus albus]
MDFYHSWIYQNVFNTEWFMWIVVCLILGINIIAPLIVWYFITGKKLLKRYLQHKKQNGQQRQGAGKSP